MVGWPYAENQDSVHVFGQDGEGVAIDFEVPRNLVPHRATQSAYAGVATSGVRRCVHTVTKWAPGDE
ncbi:MAG TPA: hypothetical protein VMK83_12000 [Gaiellaceae bacterium]|nr:hypothetical protein [Gaiellaceae bacterium]